MSAEPRTTKTERRILQTLHRYQTHGDLECGRLATYEALADETLCSMPALLRTCQRMVQEGSIVRRKINAADRRRWEHQWRDGYARRQAHFSLSIESLRRMEAAQDDFEQCFQEDFRRQIAEDQAGRGLQISNGGYPIPDGY
jgi:hypothetical protein